MVQQDQICREGDTMMFWAGMVIGAVLGACAMCVVSYNRDQEYQRMLYRAHTRTILEKE